MIVRVGSLFFFLCACAGLQTDVVVKDTLSDKSNYIDGNGDFFVINTAPPGTGTSRRGYIVFSPEQDGLLGEVEAAFSFGNTPVNNPDPQPFSLDLAFFGSLSEAEAEPERIDFQNVAYTLDTSTVLGSEDGWDVFKAAIDLSTLNLIVEAENQYLISLSARNGVQGQTALLHVGNPIGQTVGLEDDYYFFFTLGGPFPLEDFPLTNGTIFASKVSIQVDKFLGDVNLDGVVNLLDVAPFVERILTGTFQAEADINQDGEVNLLDVAPFVELLTE